LIKTLHSYSQKKYIMKKLILVLLLFSVPLVYVAQSFTKDGKTYSQSSSAKSDIAQKNAYWEANSNEIFIEVLIEEYYDGNGIRVSLNLGDHYNSLLSSQKDKKLFEDLFNEVSTMNNIPDLLGYLTNEGFEIINYSTLSLDDYIRHQIILSQRFVK